MESFNFSTTSERLEKIERLNGFPSKSDFINRALDFYIEHLETRYLIDFMYYIGFPFLALLGFVGLSMFFANWFFYICTIIVGIYIIILAFLFGHKYKNRGSK